jgi:hypothetical protein
MPKGLKSEIVKQCQRMGLNPSKDTSISEGDNPSASFWNEFLNLKTSL